VRHAVGALAPVLIAPSSWTIARQLVTAPGKALATPLTATPAISTPPFLSAP
jgi:hypothetical protein